MKSTLKIVSNRHYGDSPRIKIVIPLQTLKEIDDPTADIDEKDVLLRDFIQQKEGIGSNQWFRLDANFTAPVENPTHQVSTIRAVKSTELLMELKCGLLNMLPNSRNEDLTIKYPKAFEFFDWIKAEIEQDSKTDRP